MRFRNSRLSALIGLLFLFALSLSGCGYTHPYAKSIQEGEDFKKDAIAIYADMWANQSSELGYEAEIKQALFRWLKKSPHFTMARSKEQADYILTGTVNSLYYPGLSYGTWDRAVELRARVSFSFALRERTSGTMILQNQERRWHESFPASEDAATTERHKREALREIAEHIAENMYIQLTYRFSHPQTTMTEQPDNSTSKSESEENERR